MKALAIVHKAAAGGVVARRVVPGEVVDRGVGAAVVTAVAGMEPGGSEHHMRQARCSTPLPSPLHTFRNKYEKQQ